MIDVEKLKDVRNRSYEFLVMAYWLSDNHWNTGATFKEVLDKLKWDYEDYGRIEDFLLSEGLIKRWTMGGVNGTFHVTFAGIVQAEQMVLEGIVEATIIVDNEGVHEQMDMRDKIIDKQEKRGDFLLRLYEACEGSPNRWVTIRPIAEAMKLDEEEALGIEQYLEGAYLVERVGGGGWNGSLGLTQWGIQRVQNLLLYPTDDSDGIRTKKKRGANADTKFKMAQLRKKRSESISKGIVQLGWMQGCQEAGIYPETVITNDPELRERWDDASYT